MSTLTKSWILTLILLFMQSALAQQLDLPPATPIDMKASVTGVTVYRGRASVTRSGSLQLEPGLYDLRFLNLPETIQPETLQARVSKQCKVLEVQYDQISAADVTLPETEAIDRQIEELQGLISALDQQLKLIRMQEDFLNQVGVRAASDATDQGGTSALDLDAIRQQLQFIIDEQTRLNAAHNEVDPERKRLEKELRAAQNRRKAIAGSSQFMRIATVTIMVAAPSETSIELSYLVTGATWQPSYNIRTTTDGDTVDIEYDAQLTQRSGEDWNRVDLTLSTAQPTLAANPPVLNPRYVDVLVSQGPARSLQSPETDLVNKLRRNESLSGSALEFAFDAQVSGEGPAVTYHLPRPVTLKTNIQKQQRSRITTIQSRGEFIHVAMPILTEAVYIRGELTNNSSFLLLPGPVSIFVGQDYVGPTQLATVPPDGTFELYFGIDQSIKATRQLITKKTTKTGLLGGGLKTSYDYRIEIENGAGKGITLELWDRYPISRSDQITVDLVGLSHPLAADAEYLEEQKPLGLLKWDLAIPPANGNNAAFIVEFGVRINRAKNVPISGLPD
ncbi:MAG: mucoidy inhibitor MuiA family protein [Planctomycetes bacterium]|nr:mucoidy inhibitor MuiA family protein [Planctomycetota bacterium]